MQDHSDKFSLVFLCLFIILVYGFCLHRIVDNDVFWHIKTGQYILEHKAVPSVDIYSYTISAKPWLNNQWLAEVIFYIIYRLFNFNGLLLFEAAFVCLTFLTAFLPFYKRGIYSWIYSLIAILAVVASSGRFLIRPENFTFFFTALYLYIFIKKQNMAFCVPFLQCLWANMHGGFILGILLTGFWALGSFIEGYRQEGKINLKANFRPFIILAAAFFACFINPYGSKLVAYPFFFLNNKFLQKYVLEWLSPFYGGLNIKSVNVIAFITLAFISLLVLALNIKRLKPFHLFSLIAFFYLGITSRRNMALFAIVGGVFSSDAIARAMESSPAGLKRIFLRLRYPAGLCVISLSAFLIFTLVTNRYFAWAQIPQDFGLGIAYALQPIGAVRFIQDNNIRGRIFNDYDFGGYLIFTLYPQEKVFIDGRIDTYGRRFYEEEYAGAYRDKSKLNSLIDKYGINIFLLKMDKEESIMSWLLEGGTFKLVYFDYSSVLLLKDTAANRGIIDRYTIDVSDKNRLKAYDAGLNHKIPVSYGMDSLSIALGKLSGSRRFPLEEYNLGGFYSRLGAVELAEGQYKRGILAMPEYKTMHYCLGNVYFRNGMLDKAINAYSEVLAFDKKDYRVYKVLGDIYLRKKDFPKAALAYEKTILLCPLYDINIYRVLGLLYQFQLKCKDKAKEYYSKYLKFAKDAQDREEVLGFIKKLE